MDSEKLQDKYFKKLNKDVLPGIDFKKLHQSCQGTDKQYAKEVLKSLHDAFADVYKTTYMTAGEFEFVAVPAIIKTRNTGITTIGLVTLDIESSGEHWGTIFFTDKGIIDDCDENLSTVEKEHIDKNFVPYDYWYTVDLARDHHVDFENAPEEICEMREYCLSGENDLQMTTQQQ
jgi:hypothetical protein